MTSVENRNESFHEAYLRKTNRNMVLGPIAQIPVAMGLGAHFGTGVWTALILGALITSGPALSFLVRPKSKLTSVWIGIALMCFSALWIHLARGMIEMHFHILVGLATLIVFGNPWVVLAATVTVAIHHVSFFYLLPQSLFNYQASLGIVIVHALFVVIETIPACLVSLVFGRFILAQGTVLASIETVSSEVNHEVRTLGEVNRSLAQAAENQNHSVHETATTLQSMTEMAAESAENASEAARVSGESRDVAVQGKEVVGKIISTIGAISESNENVMRQIESSLTRIDEITAIIAEIGRKTKVINDIVFQTKLLSFNASVEAARAGEHGKGFAVVAEEVGKLAQMSGNSAREIESMLSESVARVQEIVESSRSAVEKLITEGRRRIQEGTEVGAQCGSALDQVVEKVSTVSEMIGRIAQGNQTQRDQIGRVKDSMDTISQNTDASRGSVEKSVSATEQLQSQAQILSDTISELVHLIRSGTQAEKPSDTAAVPSTPEPEVSCAA